MKRTDYRFVRVSADIEIPVPNDCTPQEEQIIIAQFKAQNNLTSIEHENEELAKAIREGSLVSADELMRTLGFDSDNPEKSA